GIAVDDTGAAYITGDTTSLDFPTTPGAYQTDKPAPGLQDVVVAKLTPDGSDLVYATYLGGDGDDIGSAIAVDDTGAAYVVGRTGSDDFPLSDTAFQDTRVGGSTTGFVTKLAPDGDALAYSTLLGGAGTDSPGGVAVNGDGAAHVAGDTASDDFPTTAGAFQEIRPGGGDGFLTKVAPDGTDLDWSTYVGGSDADSISGVGVADGGTVSVGGATRSDDLPTTPGAYQEAHPSATDPAAYVLGFDPDGDLVFGTFFGGTNGVSVSGFSVAADGSTAFVGSTSSTDLPFTPDAFDTEPDGALTNGYVARISGDGADVLAATYLGARGRGGPLGDVAVADDGTMTITGTAESATGVPVRDRMAVYSSNHDPFVGRLSADGTDLIFGTHLGARAVDMGRAVALGPDGLSAYVAGGVTSDDFPTTPEAAYPDSPVGGLSTFVLKISPTPEGEPYVTGLSPRSGPENGGTGLVITGRDLTGATAVSFGSEPAADFTVDADDQITATSPPGTGTAHVTVTTAEGTSPPNPVSEFTYAPGLWERTGQLSEPRFDPSLTLLADGRVLAAGGRDEIRGGVTTDTAEVFDPLTGQWSPTGSLGGPRSHHSATLLPDGRVLVAGGFPDGSTGLASAEVYDPEAGEWSPVDEMEEARGRHVAARLDDGRVLVAGGQPGPRRDSAEIFDPSDDTWETTGAMTDARNQFAGDVLTDGRVLVVGGPTTNESAEIYAPATGEWSPIADTHAGRRQHHGIALDDGGFLVISGVGAGKTAEVYDPDTDEWTASLMVNDRWEPLIGKLPSGQVLVAGGADGGPYSEVYDPATNDWTASATMHLSRASWRGGHRNDLVLLSSDPDTFADDPAVCGEHCGKLLVAGASTAHVAELYTPQPTVTGIEPDAAPSSAAGEQITITGFNLTDASAVHFGDLPADSVEVVSSTELTVTTPSAPAGDVDVTVTTPGGVSPTHDETSFRFDAAPSPTPDPDPDPDPTPDPDPDPTPDPDPDAQACDPALVPDSPFTDVAGNTHLDN
ncbi:MAG: kelch repeat-containing protein, partial [Egibacteraceae bacterium]